MLLSDALSQILQALLDAAPIADACGPEVYLDYPGDPERDAEYRPENSKSFIYLGPVTYLPATECGGLACRFRLYAVCFDQDRGGAHDLVQAAVAALDERFGGSLTEPAVIFIAGGDVIEPFNPKSAYADFSFNI